MNESALVGKMADIQLPAPPDWQALLLTLSMAAVLISIVTAAGLYLFKKTPPAAPPRRPEPSALEQLHALEQDWISGAVSPRHCAYQLAAILRQGLQLARLDNETPPMLLPDPQQWQDLVQRLDRFRYPADSSAELGPQIFDQVRTYLDSNDDRRESAVV